MNQPFHCNLIDILWAPAKALSAKKIGVMTIFLIIGLIIYDVFAYVAFAIEGENLETIWSVFNFFPFYKGIFNSALAQTAFGAGCALALIAVMLGMTGVCVIETEALRGNRFFSLGQAIRFARGRFKQILLAELSIVLLLLFILLLFAIFGFICRLPFLGPWIFAVFFVIPNFIVGIFTVFILVVFLLSWMLLPAVAAAERKGEVFQSILESFAVIIRQPVRWGFYTAYALAAGKLASFIYAVFCFQAVQLVTWASSIGGGYQLKELVQTGLALLPIRSDVVKQTFSVFPGVDWSIALTHYLRVASGEFPGYIMAFMLFVIFTSIVGYFLSVIATAQTRAYVIIRVVKDDYNITEEPSLTAETPAAPEENTTGDDENIG